MWKKKSFEIFFKKKPRSSLSIFLLTSRGYLPIKYLKLVVLCCKAYTKMGNEGSLPMDCAAFDADEIRRLGKR